MPASSCQTSSTRLVAKVGASSQRALRSFGVSRLTTARAKFLNSRVRVFETSRSNITRVLPYPEDNLLKNCRRLAAEDWATADSRNYFS
jgi:hypothetical protein